jgi:peptidoglycan/xylan/chitin deacetylase (PgdA/CDA1 family)
MQVIVTWLCAALGLSALIPGAAAENVCPPTALGVSRTAEIDTTGGPWFGSPRGDKDFLAPGEVVLTFDDGPTPRNSRTILAALAAHCTKATFFMLGEMAAEYPSLVKEIATLGHTIGTHTWSHPNLKRLSEEQARAQIESAFTVIEKAAEQPIAPFFRYPYLSENESALAHLQSRNVAQFAIDIDSFDWRTRSPQSVIARVMAGLERRGKASFYFMIFTGPPRVRCLSSSACSRRGLQNRAFATEGLDPNAGRVSGAAGESGNPRSEAANAMVGAAGRTEDDQPLRRDTQLLEPMLDRGADLHVGWQRFVVGSPVGLVGSVEQLQPEVQFRQHTYRAHSGNADLGSGALATLRPGMPRLRFGICRPAAPAADVAESPPTERS